MVNTVGKNVSEVERAYTAGFLDADGSIMAIIEKHREKKFGFRIRVVVKITQKDEKILNWFSRKYKVGHVRKNGKTSDWIIRDQKIIKEFLSCLLNYLKIKKRQAEQALKILDFQVRDSKDILKLACLADALSRLNVRSKNRRKNLSIMVKESFSRND